jgi:uncharacterized protein (TIGR03083 family)
MQDPELVDALAAVWNDMAELCASLTEDEYATLTDCPGWSVKDNLAHILAIEAMLLGDPAPEVELPDDLSHVKNDVGRMNEAWVEVRRGGTGADVLAEFRAITGRRLAVLRALAPEDFAADSWTPMGPGTVSDLLGHRLFDSWAHDLDIHHALGRVADFDSPGAIEFLQRIADAMPFVIGKKVKPGDGATVVFHIEGPFEPTVAIGVIDGRAKLLDAPPDSPTVALRMDDDTFSRLGLGRGNPADVAAHGRVRMEGDVALGQRVLENMNFMF